MKFSAASIAELTYTKTGNKADYYWNSALPGFGVRVYPSGRRVFVMSYRLRGKKHIDVIDNVNRISISAARERAKLVVPQGRKRRAKSPHDEGSVCLNRDLDKLKRNNLERMFRQS